MLICNLFFMVHLHSTISRVTVFVESMAYMALNIEHLCTTKYNIQLVETTNQVSHLLRM